MKKFNCFSLFLWLIFLSATLVAQEIRITHGPYLQAVGEREAIISGLKR